MALNREEKRRLKKSGELSDDGAGAGGGGTRVASGGGSGGDDFVAKAPAKKEERTGVRQFIKEVRAELRKVAWPTRKETLSYSGIVAATLVIMTTLIFCLDWVFSETVLRLFNVK